MLKVRNVFCGTYAASEGLLFTLPLNLLEGRIMSLNAIRKSHGSRLELEKSMERSESRSLDHIIIIM